MSLNNARFRGSLKDPGSVKQLENGYTLSIRAWPLIGAQRSN